MLGDVTFSLDTLVRNANLGTILPGPVGVRFTPDNVLIPDMIYVVWGRQHVIGPKVVDAPPDLIVEVLSDETRTRDVMVKRDLYARFGVQEYWVVDSEARTVTVLTLTGDRYEPVPPGDDGAIASRVLPGLTLALNDAFAGVQQ